MIGAVGFVLGWLLVAAALAFGLLALMSGAIYP
jgi:hypothetical protein